MNRPKVKWEPDFSYLEKVLKRERTDRPVLFEFFMNDIVYDFLTEDEDLPDKDEDLRDRVRMLLAFRNAGYDYATMHPHKEISFYDYHGQEGKKSYSLNEGGIISDRKSFEDFTWPKVEDRHFDYLDKIRPWIPEGMKLLPCGPGGVEENVIGLVGYTNLCYMMVDDPELVKDIFDAVGESLLSYYKKVVKFEQVGALISNDDWGFNTQTLLNHQQMEEFLYPWHRKIVETSHEAGKPVLLHSCGNIYPVMDVLTDDLKYDGKHSYEDNIMKVEDAWKEYHDRIAILGGIDVNFIITKSEKDVYRRSREILELTADEGSFALGTGNSVPEYLPMEKYFTMLKAAWEF